MSTWKNLYIGPADPLSSAIATLDRGNSQICLVVDDAEHLLGTTTDGDIRRGLLRGLPLSAPVAEVMNREPVVADPSRSRDAQRQIMVANRIRQLPILDGEHCVVGLALLDNMLIGEKTARDNWVVLMAGGFGTRLKPLTDTTPKPLLHVGDKPLLERTLESLISHDFRKFMISVSYKAMMVRSHFGDGSRWGVHIEYLEETKRLGTAGPLSLIDPYPASPLLVVNGDVISSVNFANLLDFHISQGSEATMGVRTYSVQIPFGVVTTDGLAIAGIDEKPEHQFLVNAGIYVLNGSALEVIPKDTYFDMPDLFRSLIAKKRETAAFPIMEYWIDVGRIEDFQRANDDVRNTQS